MDASSILSTLLSASSISGISDAAKESTDNVKKVLTQAVPALLNGAAAQANSGDTAQSFITALTEHAKSNTSNVTSFLKNVNLSDGAKIVTHLLGANATDEIAKASGVTKKATSSILSAAAPLFMSLLGQQTSGTSSGAIGSLLSGAVKNVNVGSLLGGLLGGSSSSSAQSSTSSSSGKTGGILGGLMGLLK